MADGGRLLLFDIDGTVLDTGGAGMAALREAAVSVFDDPSGGPELDLAGSTDSGIVRGMFAHYGREIDPEGVEAFYSAYLEHLAPNLVTSEGRVLDGVVDLLDACAGVQAWETGLLTGNIARGAEMKLAHYGVWERFAFGAYGDDHHDRNRLGPVAIERAELATGRRFDAKDAVVIGDTPKDVRCGKAIGARTVAVATGRFSVDELRETGADEVLENLGDTAAAVAAIGE